MRSFYNFKSQLLSVLIMSFFCVSNASAQCYSVTISDAIIDGTETCEVSVYVNNVLQSGPILCDAALVTIPVTTVPGDNIQVQYTTEGDTWVNSDKTANIVLGGVAVATTSDFSIGNLGTYILTYTALDCPCPTVVLDEMDINESNPGVAAAGNTYGSFNRDFQPRTGPFSGYMNIQNGVTGTVYYNQLTPTLLCGSETLDFEVWFSELGWDQTINITCNVYDGNLALLNTSTFDIGTGFGNWTSYSASVLSPTGDIFFEVVTNTAGSAAGFDIMMDDMSVIQCDCESLLPVNMKTASCDCKLNAPEINFEVVSESNNDHFIISTSTNGVDFDFYTTISSIGDHGDMHLYSTEFPDYDFDYYSIAQVDMDGTRTELGIFNNDCDDELNMHVLPNPNNGVFTITINKEISQAEFYVYDSAGRIVYFKELDSSISQFNISDIADGIYNVVLIMNNKILNKKVVIEQ